MAFSRMKMCLARDASDWDADVVKVGRTVLTDTVKHRDCYFKLFAVALGANEARRRHFIMLLLFSLLHRPRVSKTV